MENVIEIIVEQQDADICYPYRDTRDCLLATAIKRQLGANVKDIGVGATFVTFNGKHYGISNDGKSAIEQCYYSAKGCTFPFTVTLTEFSK